MISLSLPYPPSANRMWRSPPGLKSPIKSREYIAWIKAATACIPLSARDEIKGKFIAEIRVDRPDRRIRDLDNLTKPLLDLLKPTPQHKGVVEDDHLAHRITTEWTGDDPVEAARIHITIRPRSPE